MVCTRWTRADVYMVNHCLQGTESWSEVKAGDKMSLLNSKPGSSSLEVTVSICTLYFTFIF